MVSAFQRTKPREIFGKRICNDRTSVLKNNRCLGAALLGPLHPSRRRPHNRRKGSENSSWTPDAVPSLLRSVPQNLRGDRPGGREERKWKASPPESIVAKSSGLARETALSPVVNSEAPAVIPRGIDRDTLVTLNMPAPYCAVHKFSNFDGVAYLETAFEPKSNKIIIERPVFICFDNLPDVVCQVTFTFRVMYALHIVTMYFNAVL
ncbi:uncharacterized protein ISCGN_000944 [Ixodes scapularis]